MDQSSSEADLIIAGGQFTGVSSSILLSPDVSVNFNEVTAEMVEERGKKKKSQEASEVIKSFATEAIIDAETVINENDVSLIDIAENKKEILVKGKPTEHNIVANEDGTFWISCYDTGKIIGKSHSRANDIMKMLVFDGVLEIVEKNTTRKATRYKFIEDNRRRRRHRR